MINQRPSLKLKKLPSSKGLLQLNTFLVKKRRNTATAIQSDVIAALMGFREQTTYCLNTVTNTACVASVNGEVVGFG